MEPGIVVVNRSELLKALKHLAAGVKGKNPPQFVFYTEDDKLHFRAGAISYYIPVTGSFEGIGHMSGVIVKGLKAFVPETEEIILYQSEDRLSFGNSRFTCTWVVEEVPSPITTPLNLSYLDTLALRYKHTPEEIQANGYTDILETAEKQKKSDIASASRFLSSYQIEYSQIERMVDKAIIRTFQDEGTEEA